MGKLIITEEQYKKLNSLLNEEVGVPSGIIDAAKKLYNYVGTAIQKMDTKSDEYSFQNDNVNLNIQDLVIDSIDLSIKIVDDDDIDDGNVEIANMGIGGVTSYDDDLQVLVAEDDTSLTLILRFGASENWKPNDVKNYYLENKTIITSSFAHELKHKYDSFKNKHTSVSSMANYQSIARQTLNFGIPAIGRFMMNIYFTHGIENLVRPSEVATRMDIQNIDKSQFYDFITNDRTFKELKNIRNFTYDKLINDLHNEMRYVNRFLKEAVKLPIENMTDDEKINDLLNLVYVNLVNKRNEIFRDLAKTDIDPLIMLGASLGIPISKDIQKIIDRNEEFFRSYFNKIVRYKDNPKKFFKDECKYFTIVATKMIKKISKIYSLLYKEPTNESIINWDLSQRLNDKKYGKRKIDTEIKRDI